MSRQAKLAYVANTPPALKSSVDFPDIDSKYHDEENPGTDVANTIPTLKPSTNEHESKHKEEKYDTEIIYTTPSDDLSSPIQSALSGQSKRAATPSVVGRVETLGVPNTFPSSGRWLLCFDPSLSIAPICWGIALLFVMTSPVLDSIWYLWANNYEITLDIIIRVVHKCLWDFTFAPLSMYYLGYKWHEQQQSDARQHTNDDQSPDAREVQNISVPNTRGREPSHSVSLFGYSYPFQWRKYVAIRRDSSLRHFPLDRRLNSGWRKFAFGAIMWCPVLATVFHIVFDVFVFAEVCQYYRIGGFRFFASLILLIHSVFHYPTYLLYVSMVACFYERYLTLRSFYQRFANFRQQRRPNASENERLLGDWTDFHDFYVKRLKEFREGFKIFRYLTAILVLLAILSWWVHLTLFLDAWNEEAQEHYLWYDIAEFSEYFLLGMPVAVYGCEITRWYNKLKRSVEEAEDLVRFDDPIDVATYRRFEKFVKHNPISCVVFKMEFQWKRLLKGTVWVGVTKLCYYLFIHNVVES